MRYPKKFLIFGKSYRIVEKPKVFDDDGTRCEGLLDFDVGIISIESTMSSQQKTQTLLHEIFHATVKRLGMTQADLSDDLEEIIVDNFATVITEIFNLSFKRE